MTHIQAIQKIINNGQVASGIAPLLFRLILAPVMIIAGYSKLGFSVEPDSFIASITALPEVVNWFGNSDWGLNLPFPLVLATVAGWTEFLGGWLLVFGLLTRLIAIPLAITMVVAMLTVHIEHGWFSITPTDPDTSSARVFSWLSIPGSQESLDNSYAASERLNRMREILEQHGFTEYLYASGKPVILNNGIEFGFIYFAMLVSLLFSGGGRYTSLDYWLWQQIYREKPEL